MAQLDAQKLQLIQELEIEMMADLYNRLTTTCYKKCIPPAYSESELAKGEAVCLDRCVAKFLDIHDRIGKKLGQMTTQDEAMMKK
ncbi:PREDICTED: mitochondrial import inner membrane translocase subunit Tim10 [Nicrophorus vespilloides]|uniref:Mitochondrial import inner membrane translocase subunit n=1 Tax=Nicrophorus vespilloides TaxID=110193 RepID=A0ABM1NDM5_NICVS|nr:PREDICTED: mitochondrial import inner membrane translocase subunit Tim10 [Nicrophorus vespilloides]